MASTKAIKKMKEAAVSEQKAKPAPIKVKEAKKAEPVAEVKRKPAIPAAPRTGDIPLSKYPTGAPHHTGFGMKSRKSKKQALETNLYNKI